MKPPVVMIPGACCGAWIWDDWRRDFEAAGYPVETPELRHHDGPPGGPADAALAGTSLSDYARDLEGLIATLPAPPVLIGHSMGGLLAQKLAARVPVRAAVLLCPAAPWGVLPTARAEVLAAMGLMGLGPFWTGTIPPVWDVARDNSLASLDEATAAAVFARFVPESGQALFECLFWMFDLGRASHVPPLAVTCPLLAIAGGDDRVIAPDTVRAVADRHPEIATFENYPGVGHMLPVEPAAARIRADIRGWLETLPPA